MPCTSWQRRRPDCSVVLALLLSPVTGARLQVHYKLVLGEATARSLLDVQGALLQRSGEVCIIVPAKGPLVVGAATERGCDCVIDDERISGRHLMFEMVERNRERVVYVTDLQSTNGVYRNSARLAPHEAVPLVEGDEVALGARAFCRFRLQLATAEELKARPCLLALSSCGID